MGRGIGLQTARVLAALDAGAKYGLEIAERAHLHSATVYRALRRLESLGMVESLWEDQSIAIPSGRPPRKYYTITAPGHRLLAESRAGLGIVGSEVPST